ncbi:hypothetical protein AB4305_12830 [Nocardia sp. 2YAB30]|uniref:hypothetical protein n=1 Tax=unclassified Nocardia TaxID=2637762 RepID=UPI003F96F784
MRCYDVTADDSKAWTALTHSFLPLDYQYPDRSRWHARLTAQETAAYRLMRWDQGGDYFACRSPSHVRRDPRVEFYWVVVPEQGPYSVRYGDKITRVPPGRALITGFDETCQMYVPTSSAHVVQVPSAEVDHRVRPAGSVPNTPNPCHFT